MPPYFEFAVDDNLELIPYMEMGRANMGTSYVPVQSGVRQIRVVTRSEKRNFVSFRSRIVALENIFFASSYAITDAILFSFNIQVRRHPYAKAEPSWLWTRL